MRTAQHIQRSLLPREVPALAGWQFTPYYKPAWEVGGDFYDFIPLDRNRLGIAIGDVSGKGVPAALVMAIARTMLRTVANVTTSPGETLARVNELISADLMSGMFITCFYALLDPQSGHLRYANAGHDLPYCCGSGSVTALRARGMPLGLMPDSRYEEFTAALVPDDKVLFYSDGLVEAHNARREMFGLPRLETVLRESSQRENSQREGSGAVSLIDLLLSELGRFTGEGWEQEDDVTLVTLQRAPVPGVEVTD